VVDTKGHQNTPTETAIEQQGANWEKHVQRRTLYLAFVNTLLAGLLTLAGAIGIVIAVCTLIGIKNQGKRMKEQCDLMKRQADLLAASMTQWVSVRNWTCSLVERTGPLSQEPRKLQVEFEIVNESTFPLTIEGTFRFFLAPPNMAGFNIAPPGLVIFPGTPLVPRVQLDLIEEQSRQYVAGELRIAVHGEIIHTGISSQPSPLMTISGHIVCETSGQGRLEYESVWLTPQIQKTEAD
jgi:hypothetical protein